MNADTIRLGAPKLKRAYQIISEQNDTISRIRAQLADRDAQIEALKTMVRVNAYRHGVTSAEVDAALAQFQRFSDEC